MNESERQINVKLRSYFLSATGTILYLKGVIMTERLNLHGG